MVALAAQALLFLSFGQIQVMLAPDQPVPYVYSDEPLVIELVSPQDITCTLGVAIVSHERPDHLLTQDHTIQLLANRPRWITAGELPPRDGPHTVRTSITQGGVTTEHISTVHRIARVSVSNSIPFSVTTASLSEDLLWALRSLPAGTLRLDASAPDIREQVRRARDELGWGIELRVDDSILTREGTLEGMVQSLSSYVNVWDVASSRGPSQTLEMAQAIRRALPNAAVHASTDDPQKLQTLLGLDVRGDIAGAHVNTSRNALRAYARAAEGAGFEGFPLYATSHAVDGSAKGDGTVRRLIEARAQHGSADVEASSLYGEGSFGPGYDEVYGALRILAGSRYAGRLSLEAGQHAEFFRMWNSDSDGDAWVIAVWTDDSQNSKISLAMDGREDLEFLDRFGNGIPISFNDSGDVVLKSRGAVRYLRGQDSATLNQIAARSVRTSADALLTRPEFEPYFDVELKRVLKNLAGYEMGAKIRSDFLMLLRSMPVIEWQWHQRDVDRYSATSLLARLAELARYAAILEQQSGEKFLEPLEVTLAKCANYQQKAVAKWSRGMDARTRWLNAEVSSLVGEARDLARFGRSIEASAVAAIAEWRARCLEVAANAPPRRNSAPEPPVE